MAANPATIKSRSVPPEHLPRYVQHARERPQAPFHEIRAHRDRISEFHRPVVVRVVLWPRRQTSRRWLSAAGKGKPIVRNATRHFPVRIDKR